MTPTQAQIDAAAKIAPQDREYAKDLWDDLGFESPSDETIETIAQWFRKVRHEYALTAARQRWGPSETEAEAIMAEAAALEKLETIEARTIERCAQVADYHGAFEVATKIRALATEAK